MKNGWHKQDEWTWDFYREDKPVACVQNKRAGAADWRVHCPIFAVAGPGDCFTTCEDAKRAAEEKAWDAYICEPGLSRNLTYPPAPSSAQALRYNAAKPEHDYLLTYPGGVDAAFSPDFAYYDTLTTLGEWYRGEPSPDGTIAVRFVVSVLRVEAEDAVHDLVAALAETNARGAAKYPVGNYLKGANWRQYCQSAIRHAQALQAGEDYDSEGTNHLGALVFNILALDMCVAQNLGTDDRIRVPKP